jgi:hypothetical protein
MVFQSIALKPFSTNGTYLFITDDGYGEGRICNINENSITIQWVQHSQKIFSSLPQETILVPRNQLVLPKRFHPSVSIPTSCKYATGYFHPGFYEKISKNSTKSLFLSGLSINLKKTLSNTADLKVYPILNSLTLRDDSHWKLFQQLFNVININCIRYLQAEIKLSEMPLDNIVWMLNALLYIDDHPRINKEIVSSILKNFLADYTQMSTDSWIRSPLNYLLDYHQIQGVFWKNRVVIFVPAYQENLIYSL